MIPCDNCIETECEVNGHVCPLYEKYQESKENEIQNDDGGYIYFSDLVECPDCHKRCEWGSMIWLNGHCTCPQCYEHRRRDLDQQRGKTK